MSTLKRMSVKDSSMRRRQNLLAEKKKTIPDNKEAGTKTLSIKILGMFKNVHH